MTEETKEKIRRSKKGCIPWNKGKKGLQKATDETRKKLSLARKANKYRLGKIPWNKGKTVQEDPRIPSGEKCGAWKGGKAKDKRTGFLYKIWRSKVFERDNWTCQTCRIRGVFLEAHHVKSWSVFKELRYELDNGVTLCKECHKMTDNYKGKNHELPSDLGNKEDNGAEEKD